jgi:hypothetical protein
MAHAGCNWEGCNVCFPHLTGKLPTTDAEQFDRALAVANGARLRDTERLDPIAVARHAAKLLKIKS